MLLGNCPSASDEVDDACSNLTSLVESHMIRRRGGLEENRSQDVLVVTFP